MGYYASVLNEMLIYLLLTYAVWLVFSAGVLGIGHAGFMLLGAYGAAITSIQVRLPFVLSVLAGVAIAAVVGLLFAPLILRLKSYYLALATLAFNVILQIVVLNGGPLTGGATGLLGIFLDTTTTELVLISAVIVLFVWRLQHTPIGRSLSALRQDSLAAMGCGIRPLPIQLFVFCLSAALAGLAGALQAHLNGYVGQEQFGFDIVTLPLAMAVLGGIRHWSGPVFGSFLLVVLPEMFRFVGDYRNALAGLLLLLIILLEPRGLVGLITRLHLFTSRLYLRPAHA